jgi:manganese efflux pump family protein
MLSSPYAWGQFVTVLIMAVALGMDAFSLGIGVGMRGIRLLHIVQISLIIGLMHVLMPLMGMVMGHYFSTILGQVASTVGGGLLILLGGHMIYNSLFGDQAVRYQARSAWSIWVFALSVSIDSFSVGVSLGLVATDIIVTVLLFGFFGAVMSVMGLMLGRRVGNWVGEYGETFGGMILLGLGIRFLM